MRNQSSRLIRLSNTHAEPGRSHETIAPGLTLIQSVTGPCGSRLATWLDSGRHLPGGYLRRLVRPLESIVVRNGSLAFLWKVVTAESLPNRWERR